MLETLETKTLASFDTVVCGGGPAGCAAAIASARNGAKTALIEYMPFAGGVPAAAGVNGIGTWFWDVDGSPLIAGIPQELITAMYLKSGGDPEFLKRLFSPMDHAPDYEKTFGGHWLGVNPEVVKLVLDDLLVKAGISIWFSSQAVRPVMDGKRVTGVCMEGKSGRLFLPAHTVIDATGDGDIAVRAGAEFTMGRAEDGLCQPMSQIFATAGVSYPDMYYGTDDRDPNPDPLQRNRFRGAIAQARELGVIRENPNDIFCAATPLSNSDRTLCAVNFTRVQKLPATDAESLTKALISGRRQVSEALDFIRKYIPGGSNARLAFIYPDIGIRETRHIAGDVTLTGADVLSGRRFEDSIARGIYLMDIHNPEETGKPSTLIRLDQPYSIPFGAMLPKGIDGLITAGRCISADHAALSSCRIVSHCMAQGEAAGTAAALAADQNVAPRALNRQTLRKRLTENGANPGPA